MVRRMSDIENRFAARERKPRTSNGFPRSSRKSENISKPYQRYRVLGGGERLAAGSPVAGRVHTATRHRRRKMKTPSLVVGSVPSPLVLFSPFVPACTRRMRSITQHGLFKARSPEDLMALCFYGALTRRASN